MASSFVASFQKWEADLHWVSRPTHLICIEILHSSDWLIVKSHQRSGINDEEYDDNGDDGFHGS